jgi:hypothetical protein
MSLGDRLSRLFVCLLVTVPLCLVCCLENRTKIYTKRLGIEANERYNQYVIVLELGCHTCKDRFYDYVVSKWPESSALVFKRKPDKATLEGFPELFEKDFVFVDSLDISFELGLTDKNTEMSLIKEGKVKHYTFLEYNKLIEELEKN